MFKALSLSLLCFATSLTWADQNPDEEAAEAAAPFENPSPKNKKKAVPIGEIPGDNYEQRVQKRYFNYRKEKLKQDAQMFRDKAKFSAGMTFLGLAGMGASAAALSVGKWVYPNLYTISGYVGAGVLALGSLITIITTIVKWKELPAWQIAVQFLGAALGAGGAIAGFLNPAGFGIAFLWGVGILSLATMIFSAIAWGRNNAAAAEAEEQAAAGD